MRILITGSSDGLGFLAGQLLADEGHGVVLHARDDIKARALKAKLPRCEDVVVGDVSTLAAMQSIAAQANTLGRFDAVIHNVALGTHEDRVVTADGLTQIFAVNVVAPYVLTALMEHAARLIYLCSDMHTSGDESLDDPQWESRRWNGSQAYSDTKLHDLTLAMFVAGRRPDAFVNAVTPGWVPTRMGGPNAPEKLIDGATTQAWLAVSDEPSAKVTGKYFYHRKPRPFNRAAARPENQQRLIDYLERITKIRLQ